MIPILDSKRQYAKIGDKVEKEVLEVLRSGQYILGKHNTAFSEEIASYIGTKYAVTLNSGTDALHLALRALDIGPGDEVITTAFTFVATTEAIGIVGATPVFADINPDTFNIDPQDIENKITPKTKAIIPVHLNSLQVQELAESFKLVRIPCRCRQFALWIAKAWRQILDNRSRHLVAVATINKLHLTRHILLLHVDSNFK